MIVLGTPGSQTPQGHFLRVQFDRAKLLAHGDCFRFLRVQQPVAKIPYAEGEILIGDRAGAALSQGAEVRIMRAERADGPWEAYFFGLVDFVDIQRTPDSLVSVRFESRGGSQVLMDRPIAHAYADTLEAVANAIAWPLKVRVEGTRPPAQVFANARSAYGVLRLLAVTCGASLGCEADGSLTLCTYEAAIQKARAEPLTVIDADDVESFQLRQGKPVVDKS